MKIIQLLIVCCCGLLLLPAPALAGDQLAGDQEDAGCTIAELPYLSAHAGVPLLGSKDRRMALPAAARMISAPAGDNTARDRDMPSIQAQQASAEGRLDQTSARAEDSIVAQRRPEQLMNVMSIASGVGLLAGLGILVILIVRVVWERKRAAREPAAKNADLLATLLAQPPRASRPQR